MSWNKIGLKLKEKAMEFSAKWTVKWKSLIFTYASDKLDKYCKELKNVNVMKEEKQTR